MRLKPHQVASELGPSYVPYICSVLRAACPDRGFTAHVVGYTMHAVLDSVVKTGIKARRATKEAALKAAAAAAAGVAADVTIKGPKVKKPDAGSPVAIQGAEGEEEEEEGAEDASGEVAGVLDDSVELVLPMIEAELFGDIAEAKEVASFAANYKEAKKVGGGAWWCLVVCQSR